MRFLKAMSPEQWLKNGLIFIPAIFATIEWDQEILIKLLLTFAGFSLITSSIYIQNDLKDKSTDQQHPEKKKRAIASELVSQKKARILQLILLITGISTLLLISMHITIFAASYVVINLLYTEFLKQVPIIDLLCILSGYYIRLLIGQELANAPLSTWVLLMVGLLAVYLVLMKRFGDVQLLNETNTVHRKTVHFYKKLSLKNTTMVLIHCITLVFAGYIHFVFANYPEQFTILPYLSIPLAYVAILSYHMTAIKFIQKDPISVLISNIWSLSFLLISFIILIITLYPIV